VTSIPARGALKTIHALPILFTQLQTYVCSNSRVEVFQQLQQTIRMPARAKRNYDDVIDLTADSSGADREQPQRKVARLPRASVNRNQPSQSVRDSWAQDEEYDGEDIIDLSQEVDNNGIGFVEVGRIGLCSEEGLLMEHAADLL
jgi:hypothetical protein